MEQAVYRALAPATEPRSTTLKPDPVSKRRRTNVACDVSRERRTGCNGARPVCAACWKRDTKCTYVNQGDQEMRPMVLKREKIQFREKIVAFKQILLLLENMPPTAARDTLERLKNGSDPAALLKTLQGYQFKTVPSAQDTVRAMLPPIDSKLRVPITHSPSQCISSSRSLRAQSNRRSHIGEPFYPLGAGSRVSNIFVLSSTKRYSCQLYKPGSFVWNHLMQPDYDEHIQCGYYQAL